MAWVSPTTNVSGTLITASWGNSNVRDNTLELRGTPANRCSAYHNTTQTVTSGNTTALNLNSEERDTAAMHDNATNNSRVTVPSGGSGDYWIHAQTYVAGAAVGRGTLHLRKTGGATFRQYAGGSLPGGGEVDGSISLVVPAYSLVAGDYIEMFGQASGANVDFGHATVAQASRLELVGPLPAA